MAGWDGGEINTGDKKMIGTTRITFDPNVMGGKPCIRGMRVTVGTIVGLIASGYEKNEILRLYPYLESEDIDESLSCAAWRVEEIDVTPENIGYLVISAIANFHLHLEKGALITIDEKKMRARILPTR